jgi:DNA polymerase-3 subunit epsilon
MKDGKKWVVVDTETNTLYPPLYVIEIAAQLMEGWTPVGEPFRIFINHRVKIDPDAKSIHGYDEAFLEKNGINPLKAYEEFRNYARDYPLVAHNLAFDWNRALSGEYERLGIPPIGTRGFCTLMLSRRVIPEVDNHRLDTLKEEFELSSGRSHQALNDVICLVQLISKVIAPRLDRISLETFEMVDKFSKKDTKQCRLIIQTVLEQDFGLKYHIARQGKIIGSYSIIELKNLIKVGEFNGSDYYWTKNMGNTWGRLSDIIDGII